MNGVEQVEQISGNIQISEILPFTAEDKGFQSIKYFLTYHTKDMVEAFEQIKEVLIPMCNKYVFGEEYGKKGMTPHIQGAFILHSKMRASTINKEVFNGKASLFKLKNWDRAFKYCCKEGNNIISSQKIPKPLKIIDKLYGWQNEVLELIKVEPNDRDIIWVYGGYGTGKTQFGKYLVHHKYAFGPLDGEKRHILSVVGQNVNEECFIIYLTADESIYQKHSLFDCIEKIKDGWFMSHFGTENTGPIFMNSPHIIVMANERPDFDKTNMDQKRFRIYNIGPHKKVCPNMDECEIVISNIKKMVGICKKCKKRVKKDKNDKWECVNS